MLQGHETTAEAGPPGEGGERPLVLRLATLEVVIGLMLFAVALWFWISAGDIEDEDGPGIGPTAFPRGIAVVLGLACLALVIKALARLRSGRPGLESVTGRPIYVLAGIAIIIAFPAAMASFGYYPAMGLLIPALLLVAGYRRPVGIVLYTAGFLAFTKVVFGMILKTPLP